MELGGADRWKSANDALAAANVVGVGQRDEITALWQERARLDAQIARRVAEFDTAAEWSVDGSRSAASWLVRNLRLASGEAHHQVRIARQMAQMPIANAAWQEGRISSRHVDALTSVRHAANADAEFAAFEKYLVDVALTAGPKTSPPLVAAGATRSTTSSAATGPIRQRRRSRTPTTNGGARVSRELFTGSESSTAGSTPKAPRSSRPRSRRGYERNHRADDPRTPAQQRADAIVDIFQHYLDHQDRGTNRPHLMVAIDDATLAGEAVGRCETFSGYQLGPETARRLACDAIIQRIVLDSNGVPLDMGRATRTFTPDQYRAIMIRDGGCRMPGCDAGPEDCQAHHATTFWENGGRTDLAVGLAVCRGAGHHRLIHEGGWTITGDPNGEVTFHDPEGNPRGTSRPRTPPKPILTRTGRDIARARDRALDLAV